MDQPKEITGLILYFDDDCKTPLRNKTFYAKEFEKVITTDEQGRYYYTIKL